MHNYLFMNEDDLQNALILLLTTVFLNDNHRKDNHNDFHESRKEKN